MAWFHLFKIGHVIWYVYNKSTRKILLWVKFKITMRKEVNIAVQTALEKIKWDYTFIIDDFLSKKINQTFLKVYLNI